MDAVLIETANRTLARKGYSPGEARVEPTTDRSADQARLHGSLLLGEETDLVARLLRLVDMLPRRDELLEFLTRAPAAPPDRDHPNSRSEHAEQ
ncbi:MAG: hypothetical protein ICV59_02140 [Thermoleophilia bacterium]|nr:hypothetical protein [Thermoleophilia bacterium]